MLLMKAVAVGSILMKSMNSSKDILKMKKRSGWRRLRNNRKDFQALLQARIHPLSIQMRRVVAVARKVKNTQIRKPPKNT